jgi:hypothetical protein
MLTGPHRLHDSCIRGDDAGLSHGDVFFTVTELCKADKNHRKYALHRDQVRDSLNTIGILGLKALHVQMAEAIKPQSGMREGSKGKGGTIYASSTASSLRVGHVHKREHVEAVVAGLHDSHSCGKDQQVNVSVIGKRNFAAAVF